MSLDDDTTTIGEYFEPIPLTTDGAQPLPVSAELVRVLTHDIRTATARQGLNTPGLAEVLIAKGWRPVAPSSLLPSWASALVQVCVTVECSRCSDPLGNRDYDPPSPWHYLSAKEGQEAAVDAGWKVLGDMLLCEGCVEAQECELKGHDWVHDVLWPSEEGKVEFWRCRECQLRTFDDPATRAKLTLIEGGA